MRAAIEARLIDEGRNPIVPTPAVSIATDERDLLLRFRDGNRRAFAELVQRYRAPVFSCLVRCGVSESDRDDLFQEVFVRVYRAAGRYRPEQPLHPWLFTIVANAVRSYLRRRRVRQLLFVEPGGEEPKSPAPDGEQLAAARQTLAFLEWLGRNHASGGPTLGIVEAVRSAAREVAREDDPGAPLGSSAVIVVTPGSLASDIEALRELGHRSALAGVPLGVVGLGKNVDIESLDRLVLAGRGNRRLLLHAADAAELVDRELQAVGRTIARAIRLRVRLAPGVRLVGVFGSEWLNEERADRVRAVERSIDRRLADHRGIAADRGEDEDGIQIVIPAFYAGEHHVVLLDVVAPGPGPIADVQARYKDLVHLRNGVAADALELPAGETAPGPLERNVLRNFVALHVAGALERAGWEVLEGNVLLASARLRAVRGLLRGLSGAVPGLAQDREWTADVGMVDGYLAVLRARSVMGADRIAHLADSLRYAARRKVLPAPTR